MLRNSGMALVVVWLVVPGLTACDGGGGGGEDAGARLDGGDGGSHPPDGSAPDASDPDSGTSPPDAGTDGGLPAPSCAMGRIRIQQTCPPALAPCGGAVVGEWCYADVCIEKDELLEEALMQPGVPSGCTADSIIVVSSNGTIDGTLTFTDTTFARMITSNATGKFYLPPECVIVNCRATEAALNSALGENGMATCTAEAPGCVCDITFMSSVDDSGTYTLSGSSILTGSGRRFDYCVEGDGSMRLHEVADSGGEPGVQTVLPVSGG